MFEDKLKKLLKDEEKKIRSIMNGKKNGRVANLYVENYGRYILSHDISFPYARQSFP